MFWKCAQNLRNSKTFWTCAQDLHRITRYCRNPARKWWKQIISPEAGDFWFTNFKCWKFKEPTITLDDDTTMILEILGANFYSWWWKWWWWWWWWFAGSKYDQSATECSLCLQLSERKTWKVITQKKKAWPVHALCCRTEETHVAVLTVWRLRAWRHECCPLKVQPPPPFHPRHHQGQRLLVKTSWMLGTVIKPD